MTGKQLATSLSVMEPLDLGDGAWRLESTINEETQPERELFLEDLLVNAELVTNVGK